MNIASPTHWNSYERRFDQHSLTLFTFLIVSLFLSITFPHLFQSSATLTQSIVHSFNMRLRPRECFNHFHLIILAGLVAVALTLIVVGGAISAWCIRYGNTFECHSLLHCERAFSCAFKLLPAGIIFCLLLSLFTFVLLILGQVKIEYSGLAKKEYQLVARWGEHSRLIFRHCPHYGRTFPLVSSAWHMQHNRFGSV